MLSSRAYTGAALLVALLISSPLPLTGYIVRTQSTYSVPATASSPVIDATPATPTVDATPASPTVEVLSSANPFASATTLAANAKATAAVPATRTQAVTTLAADNSTSTDDTATALYAVLRVIGSSVTPFNYARQSTLLNALGQVISYVDFSSISIMDVNPVYSTSSRRSLLMAPQEQLESYEVHVVRRRSLLASALSNVADVTVEMQAESNTLATQALGELDDSITNGTLATQLQSLGQSSWAVQMENYTVTQPGAILPTVKTVCHDQFGHWCLDKHKHLSSQGLKGVIAGGVIGIIAVAALALLLKDLHGARRNRGEEVVYNPQTPNLGGGKAATAGALSVNATAGHGTPGSGATPSSAGYTGGLAPVGTKVRRQSGAFTSGAVTHPASLAAAGKPTGLEGVVTPVGTPSAAHDARRGV